MIPRRHLLAALATIAAAPALAQGKKGATDGVTRAFAIAGEYRAEGRNPDGSSYSGNVTITQQGEAVEMTWRIGSDAYRGVGTLDGRVLTVEWGADSPVVYVVMDDGELHGTWDDGRALERLSAR